MDGKHILRALDQALETAEFEKKYLRDELEAERAEKLRLEAERDRLRDELEAERDERRARAEETGTERDRLLETFRERAWAGEREDMVGKLREMRREKERLQGTVDSLEQENAKLREALEKWKN